VTQLSEHFSLEEMTSSEVAIRKGIDNTPSAEVVANLTELAMALEKVRSLLGVPMHINSAYRSPKANAAVGGSSTSAHMTGQAADFVAPQCGTPQDIAQKIAASDIAFDQLIYEGTWLHFGIRGDMRRQVLTAHFEGGKATYTQGIS
jgi:hypothetical protein